MERRKIPWKKLRLASCSVWSEDWMLLTAGKNKPGRFNVMTVGWGAVGVMWDKPFVHVVVRPSRHTYGYMEDGSDFTLCVLPEEHRDKLTLCGTKSGRDVDKVKEAGLTPIASSKVAAPGYDEAELIIECRKIYADDMEPECFIADFIEGNYGGSDYHRVYYGQIVAISGTAKYTAAAGTDTFGKVL